MAASARWDSIAGAWALRFHVGRRGGVGQGHRQPQKVAIATVDHILRTMIRRNNGGRGAGGGELRCTLVALY